MVKECKNEYHQPHTHTLSDLASRTSITCCLPKRLCFQRAREQETNGTHQLRENYPGKLKDAVSINHRHKFRFAFVCFWRSAEKTGEDWRKLNYLGAVLGQQLELGRALASC